MDTLASGPEGAREIIDRWSPFIERESSVMHKHDLHSTFLQVPVEARVEQCSIPFPDYMDRETCQRVAEDGMLICNHDFH